MTEKKCTACGEKLRFLKKEQLQLGKYDPFFGHFGNLWAGAQELEFWFCEHCGKLELYVPRDQIGEITSTTSYRYGIAQTTCPGCGTEHDLDDPKCPSCGAKNPKY